MRPSIQNIEILLADDPVVSSIVPVTIGAANQPTAPFAVSLRAGDRIAWEVIALFSLGATGGFRFLANAPAAPTVFNAQFNIVDLTTGAPAGTPFNFGQTAETAVANASAVAGTYQLRAWGSVINGVTAGTFAFQFAQNTSDVLPITILAGAIFKVWRF